MILFRPKSNSSIDMVANYNLVEPILLQMIPKDYQNVVMFIKFVQTYFDVLKSSNVNKHTKMK